MWPSAQVPRLSYTVEEEHFGIDYSCQPVQFSKKNEPDLYMFVFCARPGLNNSFLPFLHAQMLSFLFLPERHVRYRSHPEARLRRGVQQIGSDSTSVNMCAAGEGSTTAVFVRWAVVLKYRAMKRDREPLFHVLTLSHHKKRSTFRETQYQ